MRYLAGEKIGKYYNYIYIIAIVIASVIKLDFVINVIDSAYALMAIPTVLSTLLLAPKVKKEATLYFKKLQTNSF